ncbi:MAG: DNA polymerase I [Oscillospiraceae bacterium]|nr:DNA polymerase I [Oscillospiraceae bacterium]
MKILALDGNSILNRAFYGIKLLTTKDGQYTNGIYGFLNILLKLESEVQPDRIAIAFDLKGKTFRHKMYDDYKGNRKGMPDELAQQMPVLKEILADLGYTIVTKEGFEADDILGTIAKSCSARGDRCYIATGDRDSLQLTDDNVNVILATMQFGKGQNVVMDREAVFEKYGLYPESLIDLKALMGDTSDNIPGVKGVGEKTAVGLLQKFGTLDGVYENIDDPAIKKGVREKLTNDKEMAYLSKQLGTIFCEVDIETDPDFYTRKPIDCEKVSATLKKLEMFSMAEKLVPQCSVENISLFETVSADLERVEIKAFDNTLPKAVVYQNGENFIVMWDKSVYTCPADSDLLKTFLEDETKEKIAYDSKALYTFCTENDIDAKNITFCMKLAAYLANPNAQSYDFERISASCDVSAAFDCDDSFAPYAQAVYTALREFVEKENQQQLLYEIEMPLAKVLAEMEYEGFGVDKTALTDFGTMLKGQLERYLEEVYDMVGYQFNLNSPKQLGKALFEDLGLPAGKKTKSGYSTNAEVLEGLKKYHPVIEKILSYRTYQKLNSTYVEGMKDKIREDGRIHTTFNQTETRTGRISSGEPNLQNIPVRTELGQELRKFFVAKEGHILLDADYSQIELRILAHISGDESMRNAFINNEDIHTQTAAKIMNLPVEMVTPQIRSRAKAVNFGIVYGIGAFSLAKDVGITVKEASQFIQNYLDTFTGVKEYMNTITAFAKENGYVSTLYNRKRILPEINNSNRNIQEMGKRMAMNTPIQGTSADIIKIAMVRVNQRLKEEGLRAKLILQVHDELIVEAPLEEAQKAAEILGDAMRNAAQLSVPLKVDVNKGENWYVAKG